MTYSNNFKTMQGTTVVLKKGETVVKTYDQLKSITPPGGSAEKIDASHLGSPGPFKEYIAPDLKEADELNLTTFFDGTLPPAVGDIDTCVITFGKVGKIWTFTADMGTYKPGAIQVNAPATVDIGIIIKGPITVTNAV